MNYFQLFLVLSTSFCVISFVHAGILGLTHDGQNVDLSSLTSVLTGGLRTVLGAIKNPKPITIEIFSQEKPFPNTQYNEYSYSGQQYPTPDPYAKPYHHRYQNHYYHGQGPSNMYPYPPPVEGQGYQPPKFPFGGMDNRYPGSPTVDGQNVYQQYGYNHGSDGYNIDQQYGMGGQNEDTRTGMNGNGEEGSVIPQNTEGEVPNPVTKKQNAESGIHGYIDNFPVILLNENDIR